MGILNLDDIPAGSLCVINANVLIYAEQGVSLQAQRLLRRIEERDVAGVMNLEQISRSERSLLFITVNHARIPA